MKNDFLAEVDISDFESGNISINKNPLEPYKPYTEYFGKINTNLDFIGTDKGFSKGDPVVATLATNLPKRDQLEWWVRPFGSDRDTDSMLVSDEDIDIIRLLREPVV